MRYVSKSLLLFLTATLLLFSCGTPPDYVAKGFNVYTNDLNVPKHDVELVIDETIKAINEVAPEYTVKEMERALKDWHGDHDMYWNDGNFECSGSPTGKCRGIHMLGNIRIAYYPCIAYTALAHEMIHFFQFVKGTPDGKHQDERFWSSACGVYEDESYRLACALQTVEVMVLVRAGKQLCLEEPNGTQEEEGSP